MTASYVAKITLLFFIHVSFPLSLLTHCCQWQGGLSPGYPYADIFFSDGLHGWSYETEVFVSIIPFNYESEVSGFQQFPFKTLSLSSPVQDSLTLVQVYEEMDGDNWKTSNQWDLATPVATWYGIQLNNEGCVTSLILPDTDISGPISPSIADLGSLEVLHLFNNNLTGTIPAELGNLTNLRQLYLYENDLTGTLPPEIGNLTNLEEMLLYRNRLKGPLPAELGNLSKLTDLLLYENEINGSIPIEISNLTDLKVLSFGENMLEGNLPASIGSLQGLRELYLYTNTLTGTIPTTFSNLVNLEIFSLGSNDLTGTIPEYLSGFTQLRELYLYENQFSGPLPSGLASLQQLEILQLNDNSLQGCIPNTYEVFCDINVDFSTNPDLSGNGSFSAFCAGTLLNHVSSSLDTAICAGNSVQIGVETIDTEGVHEITLEGSLNCDSIVMLNLTIHPIPETFLDTFVCPSSGELPDRLAVASTGCDSIIHYNSLDLPLAEAGTDIATCDPEVPLGATPVEIDGLTGRWVSGGSSVTIADSNDPQTFVFDLNEGINELQWRLSYPGCADYSSDIVKLNYTDPSAELAAVDDSYEVDETGLLSVNVLDNDTYPDISSLMVALGSIEGEDEITLDTVGNLTFELKASSIYLRTVVTYRIEYKGCPDVFSEARVFIDLSMGVVNIPLVFTPNGDGINDRFIVPELDTNPQDFPNNSLVVFNRWGDVVFEQSPYDNNWEGIHYQTKEPLPPGTYFYLLRLSVGEGKIRKQKVTLIR